MKRTKSIWIQLLVIVLSVAMMFGCLGGVVFADSPARSAGDEVIFHEMGHIDSKVALGQTFVVPAKSDDESIDLTVNDPSGEEAVPVSENTYRAVKLGNYTVTYSDESTGLSYTYIVNCYENAEYFVYVKNNGATIPTYVKVGGNAPASFTLPDWYLAKNDADGNLVLLDNAEDGVTTSWSLNGVKGNGQSVSINGLGNQSLILSASFVGAEDKVYSQQFTVISQTDVPDKDKQNAPTLSVSNVPTSASINTKVTLPKASAADDYDDNILIHVEVTDPDGNPVKAITPNEYGYAPMMTDAEYAALDDVDFDNDRVTSFYPTKLGSYVVKYYAEDDAGLISLEHTYVIKVSDRTGPMIVDIDDADIPSTWGLNSVKGSNVTKTDRELELKIPIPTVVDNYDKFILNEADDWTGDIKMTVEVANPNATVAQFQNLTPNDINNDGKGREIDAKTTGSRFSKYFKDDITDGATTADDRDYGVKIVIPKTGDDPYLSINFNDFYDGATTASKTKAAVTGTWTISFSFRDKTNNGGYGNSKKDYSINVSDIAFVDETAPEIEAPTLPDYLIVGNGEDVYTVPNIVVSDNKDTRLDEKYYIYSDEKPEQEAARFYVEGGEELRIVTVGNDYYFVKTDKELSGELSIAPKDDDEDDKKTYVMSEGEKYEALKIGDSIGYAYSATDDAGNTATLLKDEDEETDYTVAVFTAANGWQDGNIDFSIDTDSLEAGKNGQSLGGFTIKDIAKREFVGFDLAVKYNGEDLDGVSALVSYAKNAEDKECLYVKNITASFSKGGDYEIDIRVLDAKDNSYVYAKKFHVDDVKDGQEIGPNTAALAWAPEGTARQSYMLDRETYNIGDAEGEYVRVYKIEGARFSLLGYSFTPLDQGAYTVTEYNALRSDITAEGDVEVSKLNKHTQYGMTVTDTTSTRFEVLGDMVTYMAKPESINNLDEYAEGEFYVTAPIVAYSDTANYEVTVKYTVPNGSTQEAKKAYRYNGTDRGDKPEYSFEESSEYSFFGQFAFPLEKDGEYKITATANGVTKDIKTVKIGDITAPQFTLNGGTDSMRAYVGKEFEYRTIGNVDAVEDDDDLTVYYRLIQPGSGKSEVSEVSGNMTYSEYKDIINKNNGKFKLDNTYEFKMSGDYTVEITLEDKANNKSVLKYTITVGSPTSHRPTSLTMLSTVLIIVGVLLILGVVVYLIRFRKRKA